MDASFLAEIYERDINKLIAEVKLFKNEANLWKTHGSITNMAGNLVLHLIGGNSYRIGTLLGGTGYVRDRDAEFSMRNVDAHELIAGLEKLNQTVKTTFEKLSPADLDAPYPVFFDKPGTTKGYVLTQLLLHFNYHLGQVNYLRRMLEE